MRVKFLEQKSTTSPNGRMSANYLKCEINDTIFEFPYMNATKQDYDKSSDINPLQSQHFQYFINELDSKVPDITSDSRQSQISTNFLNVVYEHNPILTDITLYYDSHEIGQERRKAFLDLQQQLNTTFLSDIEIDKNQSLEDFKNQLESLDSIDTDQIKSPTISMTTPTELFVKKLEMVLETGRYDRFNVEWGGKSKYFERWIKLSELLIDKKIICNVTAINQKRNYYEPYQSYVLKQIMTGAHSYSTGYVGFPKTVKGEKPKPQKTFVLNENTWNYDEHPEISYDFANTSSHNTLSLIASNSHAHIKNDTFFSDLVPNAFMTTF